MSLRCNAEKAPYPVDIFQRIRGFFIVCLYQDVKINGKSSSCNQCKISHICKSRTAIHPAVLDAPAVQCGKNPTSCGYFPMDTRLFCCVYDASGCQNQRQIFFLQPVQNICESGTAVHPAVLDVPAVQCGKRPISCGCFPTDMGLFCCVSTSGCQNQRQVFFLQPVQNIPHLRIWNGNTSGGTGCSCGAVQENG